MVGLITDNDETAYREEVRNLSSNVSKTKELIVDYRKRRAEKAPISIEGTVVERVESFKFIGVHITNELSWSKHTNTVVRRVRKHLFTLRRLKRFGMGPHILQRYSCTIESILTGCIIAWYGNCSASDRKGLTGGSAYGPVHHWAKLPAIQVLYSRRDQRKDPKIVRDSSHPSHRVFSLLPLGSKSSLTAFTPKP